MRSLLLGIAALAAGALGAASTMADDLEMLDPPTSQMFAQFLMEVAEKIENPQIKIEGDIEKACGVHREQIGLILVPQKGLEGVPDGVDADPGAPMAHLFMTIGFTPVIDGKPLEQEKLRTLTLTGQDGGEIKVSYLAVAARHTDDDVWHLYLYGTDEKPVIDAEIGDGAGPGTMPIALEVRDLEDETGTCYLTIYDTYQTNFKLTYQVPEGKPADDKPADQ